MHSACADQEENMKIIVITQIKEGDNMDTKLITCSKEFEPTKTQIKIAKKEALEKMAETLRQIAEGI